MITKENYLEEHIREIQLRSRKDPQLIERSLYALGLLEALSSTGMKFIFKGGSCLMLLLPHVMRLSTDIDIIVPPGTDVNRYIMQAAEIFPFVRFEEQKRIGKNNIEKQHFKFTYYSPVRKSEFYILLDILFEENNYEEIVKKEIKNELLLTDGDNLVVEIPSIDCILGDKLTAFAPHTTGIPLRVNKDMEVMKQFYDVSTLIGEHSNFENILKTFNKVATSEIKYRGTDITPSDVLKDTISSSVVIGSRGKTNTEDFPVYFQGILAVATHIFADSFNGETASYRSANIIYMASCLLTNSKYEKVSDYNDYTSENLFHPSLKPLAKMKKAQPLQYAYLVKADLLLTENNILL